ncbi:PepSY domain-containing protein [Sporosarcina sp. Marseille-Q4063]|uniref:PepSY domain-containing protein n=1 Tax=Sporosarcina sp. Marseille-Q4063 TaxID=2810514 RepID=UPI001BB04F7B|nr:PepSY domain-containing protein [Sporosarcina sp. Marseille-Q4063]QUW20999.1 PepSY domain-containing protein [Sporosarcina sp. Marseille-Q4063]
MKNLRKPWALPLIFTIIILVAGGFFIGSLMTKKTPLSSEEIQDQLETIYDGKVEKLTLEKGVYLAEITRTDALYSAEVDAVSGKVLVLNQLSKVEEAKPQILSEKGVREEIAKKYTGEIERLSLNENKEQPVYNAEVVKEKALVELQVNAITGEIISEKKIETTTEDVLITRDEAIKIALGQLKGEVEYAVFKETDDGGYYLVEIEQDNEDTDDIEAIFHIHAITGKTLFVEWDD